MAQAKVITKIKKKNWYPLIAPGIFRNAVLGETFVYDENTMIGKTVTQNLMSLTGDVKKQNTNIDFIVTKVENGKAFTDIIGYYLIPASIRRLTRRRSEKIELSFICDTSDGKHIRIKPLIFAISNIKGSVGNNLRRTATDFLIKEIKKMTYEDLITNLINRNLQSSLRENIKKIYPVRVSEIKSAYIETEKKHGEEEEVKVKEEVKKTIKKKKTEEIKAEESPAKEKEVKEEKVEIKEKVIEKKQKEEKIEVKETDEPKKEESEIKEVEKEEKVVEETKKEEIPSTHDLAKKKEEIAETKEDNKQIQ